MTTGDSDCDEHVALACLRYNTSSHTATGMTPFEAMFGIHAFEAWGEVDLEGVEEESEDLPKRLVTLHKTMLSRGWNARLRGKTQYDKVAHETVFNVGDRVLMSSTKLGKDEGKKIFDHGLVCTWSNKDSGEWGMRWNLKWVKKECACM